MVRQVPQQNKTLLLGVTTKSKYRKKVALGHQIFGQDLLFKNQIIKF